MLILWASVLAVALTGECYALEGNHRSSKEDDSCDMFQEYRDLLHLRVKQQDCTGEKEVWAILDRLFRYGAYGRLCMYQVIQELGQTFKNYSRTPSYCNCSGNYELGTYSLIGDVGHEQQTCWSDVRYKQLFETYFHSQHETERMFDCQSHHIVWHLLAGISKDLCRTDIVLHVAENFYRHHDPCICRNNNSDVHVCNKGIAITEIAHGTIVTHPNASDCSPGDHSSSEAFVFNSCNMSSTTHWRKGESIMDMCERIPLYSLIASFDNEGVFSSNGGRSGIFLGCLTGGFKNYLLDCTIKHSPTFSSDYINDNNAVVIPDCSPGMSSWGPDKTLDAYWNFCRKSI